MSQPNPLIKAAEELATKAAAVIQAQEAQIAASKPTAEVVEKVAQALLDAQLVAPEHKAEAVRALGDHKAAVDVIYNIAGMAKKASVGEPAAPVGRPVGGGQPARESDQRFDEQLLRLAARRQGK